MLAALASTNGPSRRVRAALVAVVVLPIVTAVARALRHHWFPVGDAALLAIRVRDVFTSHHPLLGSWTSASLSVGRDINNPGPLYQDVLAPVARLFPPGPGIAIAVGLANIAAVVGIVATARHIGGWSLERWMLLAAAALSWTMGSELLFDLWQPHALLLPFVAFLLLLTGVSLGRRRCVPWAVFVGSLLVQTHIGYAYVVAAFTPVAIALAWWRARPVGRSTIVAGLRSRTAWITAIVFAAAWSQPVVDQFFGDGNLGNLVASSGGGDRTLGASRGVKIVAAVVALPPWWLRRGFSTTVPNTRLTDTPSGPQLFVPGLPAGLLAAAALVVLLAVIVLVALACRRAGLQAQAHLLVICAAGVLISVASVAALTVGVVGLAAHHVRFLWPFAVVVHVALGWGITSLVALRREAWHDRVERVTTAFTLVAIIAFTALNLPSFAEQQGPTVDASAQVVLRKVFPHLDVLREGAPVVFDISNLRVFEPFSTAVMMRLQQDGIEFRVTDPSMVRQLGDGRRASGHENTTIFQLEGVAALLYDGPACQIALESGLDEAAAAQARNAVEVLTEGWTTGVHVDPALLAPDEVTALEAAADGDAAVARRLVLEGDLQRWIGTGDASVDPPLIDAAAAAAGVADRPDQLFARIVAWVVSTYGVFAESTVVCP